MAPSLMRPSQTLYDNRALTHNFWSNQLGKPHYNSAATCSTLSELGQSSASISILLPCIATQDQPKKAIGVPNQSHKMPHIWTVLCSFPLPTSSYHRTLSPSTFFCNAAPLPSLPVSRPSTSDGGCHIKLRIDSLCLSNRQGLHLLPEFGGWVA